MESEKRISFYRPGGGIRHPLIRIVKEAIKLNDPFRGLTSSELVKYIKAEIDYKYSAKLKREVENALKVGLESGQLVKNDRYRYGLNRLSSDCLLKLCGNCGGRLKALKAGKEMQRRRTKIRCKQEIKIRMLTSSLYKMMEPAIHTQNVPCSEQAQQKFEENKPS